ncbi:3090_t:CDS:2, partial [Racocetra persica]
IFDFETKKQRIQTLSDSQICVSNSAFTENGNIIMIDFESCRAYLFVPEGTGNSLKLDALQNGILRIYHFEVHFFLNSAYLVQNAKLITKAEKKTAKKIALNDRTNNEETSSELKSYDDQLLLVHATKLSEKGTSSHIIIYLANNGMKLVAYAYPESIIIDSFDIIASRVGEQSVMADKLFEVGSFKFQHPCVIIFDETDKVDKVIGFIDNDLLIKKLINEDWIKYLREELKDYNRIVIPSAESLKDLIKDSKEREMMLATWENPKFILCKCLHNDDLVMITYTDVYVWTLNTEKIQLIYYYSEKEGSQTVFKDLAFTDSFLPPPYIGAVIYRKGFNFGDQDHFKELLETYTKEEFYLAVYGSHVMNKIVGFQDYVLAENFCKSCIEINFKDENDPTPNIQLFGIISQFISKLSEDNSMFVEGFVSEISYFMTFDKYFLTQNLSKVTGIEHLHEFGFIIFAFAHSLHLLLRPATEVSLDYPSYSSDPNDPWNLVTTYNSITSNNTIEENPSLIEPPDANTNMFMWFDSSILAVYVMLTGDSTPISYWTLRDNYSLTVIMVLFSFFTTIYLMNLFISLLGNAIDETTTRESFLTLRAEVSPILSNAIQGEAGELDKKLQKLHDKVDLLQNEMKEMKEEILNALKNRA